MEKYRLVQENRVDENASSDFLVEDTAGGSGASPSSGGPGSDLPVVRITQQGKPRNYISYAMNLFVSATKL